ncbi:MULTISPECIES: hypothetical protein [Streptomyces]|uniref:hypothetical protein n=1 Tax=Streptomyces TaxID=1883 RepID=UPI000464A9B4|nr:hypothetical protein [Streptomyces exfoliatus]
MTTTDANGVDLSGVTGRLIQTVDLRDNPAPQAIATDPKNKWIFVLQLESSGTADKKSGNMYLNRINRLTGEPDGQMQLKGFGHGLSLGAVPDGTDTILWTECGSSAAAPLHFTVDFAFGKAVTHFTFKAGDELDAATIPASQKFTPPGSTAGVGPSYDPTTNLLTVMYHKDGKRQFTRYDATLAAAGTWTPVGTTFVMPDNEKAVPPDVPTKPYPVETELTAQGFQTLGGILYAYHWAPFQKAVAGRKNPGYAYITAYDWSDTWTGGERPRLHQAMVTSAPGLTHREPEGLAVEIDPDTQETRLLFGFSDTVPPTTGERNVTIGWYPTKPAVDGVKVLADWEDLTLPTGFTAGAERPRGRLIALAGTTYLQLRGTINPPSGGMTADGTIATLPHRLRPTLLARQNVPRNNKAGRFICRVEANILGELRVYGAYPDNAITWIGLDSFSTVWR